ncbi:MAG: hypothetical protein EOP83_13765 [Verrucomicrobiaceae bacterium]|nr:MAG: hypothetical protein EOP83_13765 [Verrucomicrobiaceae bacterium]
MGRAVTLSADEFYAFFDPYFERHPLSRDASDFEAKIANEAERVLEKSGEHGWDFAVAEDFFGNRGTSIVIQNSAGTDWQAFGELLKDWCESQPPGSIINFEVHDFIKGDVWDAGPMLLRWLLTSEGIFSEETTD